MTFQFPSQHHNQGWAVPSAGTRISQQSARDALELLSEHSLVQARHADQIQPGLFLGDLHAARDVRFIAEKKITHVLSVMADCPELNLPDFVEHKIISSVDSMDDPLLDHFAEAWRFIHNALEDLPPIGAPKDYVSGKILVHCREGISRSVTVLAAFLMKEERLHSLDAIKHIKRFRPQVDPNHGFLEQLHVWGQCRGELKGKPEYNHWKAKAKGLLK